MERTGNSCSNKCEELNSSPLEAAWSDHLKLYIPAQSGKQDGNERRGRERWHSAV